MATHSSILAWKIPWREEPGRLQSMGSQRVRHNSATVCVHNDVTVFSSSLHKIVKTSVLAKKVSTNVEESLPFPSHEPNKQSKQT